MQPLLLEENVSTLKHFKPVVLPIDSFDSLYDDSKLQFCILFISFFKYFP